MIRLAISNLAIPQGMPLELLSAYQTDGLRGLEIAPTRIAPWSELTSAKLRDYNTGINDAGLAVSSLQALLFGTTGLQLLGDENAFGAMCEHIRAVSDIGAKLGARAGVFGSPRNRLRGDMLPDRAWDLGRERLRKLGQIAAENGFILGLEPVPSFYGGDFLTRTNEVIRMVAEIGHPGIQVHLDTGCAFVGGDDIALAIISAGQTLAHFQIAEPKLGAFDDPKSAHVAAGTALHETGYAGWVAIEMLEQANEPIKAIREAISFAAMVYLGNHQPVS